MIIYHNPRCAKSRQTLEIINQKYGAPTIKLYLIDPPTPQELDAIIKMLGITPFELIRKNETLFKERFKNTFHSDEEWIRIMIENPQLIERPIVIHHNKAVIGRPPESVEKLLG